MPNSKVEKKSTPQQDEQVADGHASSPKTDSFEPFEKEKSGKRSSGRGKKKKGWLF